MRKEKYKDRIRKMTDI